MIKNCKTYLLGYFFKLDTRDDSQTTSLSLSSLTGSSVHKILQARILEWVAISISRARTHACTHARTRTHTRSRGHIKGGVRAF